MSFEATIEKFAGHLKDLIGVVGDARGKAESAMSDVVSVEQRVTADIEARLSDFETKVMGDVQAKLDAAVDDIGARIAALTGSAGTPTVPTGAGVATSGATTA